MPLTPTPFHTAWALGVAGLLSLAGGASAENVDPAKVTSTENAAAHHEITLEEEEISTARLLVGVNKQLKTLWMCCVGSTPNT
jgi:hypothetical protein